MAMEVSTDDGDSGDLMSVEGMEMTLALELSPVSYTHLRAHETCADLVCRLLLEKKKK